MKRTMVGIVCFCIIAYGITPVTIAQTPSQDKNLARFLLEEIQGARQKIRDVKHTAIYHDYQSPRAFQLTLERLALQLKEKYPEEQAEDRIRRLKENYSEHRFERLDVAIDSEGRARIETNFGRASEKGILVAADSTRKVVTWDGENAVEYYENSKNLKSAILSNEKPFQTTKRYRRPWRQFGGNFYDRLSRTIAESARVDVERTEDGLYRIAMFNGDDDREIGTVDPSQGYSLIRTEYHSGQHLVGFNEATFMEVSPDIWFPVKGEVVWFFENGPPEVARKTSMEVSDVVVNDPNFYDGLFQVDFPEGTYVSDRNTGLRYVVGEPMSETPALTSGVHSLNEIAIDALDDVVDEAELFLPMSDAAIEKEIPFVAALSERTLINAAAKPDSEAAYKRLSELGKGDLAWDGRLIATRGAKLLTTRQESKRPLKCIQGRWAQACALPEEAKLPYWTVVVTNGGDSYLLGVREIQDDGVRVTYRKLSEKELALHIASSKEAAEKP